MPRGAIAKKFTQGSIRACLKLFNLPDFSLTVGRRLICTSRVVVQAERAEQVERVERVERVALAVSAARRGRAPKR